MKEQTCALLSESLRCWGSQEFEVKGKIAKVQEVPEKVYGSLVVLTEEGHVVFFRRGSRRGDPMGYFNDRWLDVAALGERTWCGVKLDQTIACQVNYAPPKTMQGKFTQVSMGNGNVCGLTAEGKAHCEALVEHDRSPPPISPPGEFVELVGGCGLRRQGQLECWGIEAWKESGDALTFQKVFSVEGTYRVGSVCGVTKSGQTGCWDPAPHALNQSAVYDDFLIGRGFWCGVSEGKVHCGGATGKKPAAQPPPDLGTFEDTPPPAQPQVAAEAAPTLDPKLTALEGKYLSDLYAIPGFRERLSKVLGKYRNDFERRTGVMSKIQRHGDVLLAAGCQQGMCMAGHGAVTVDLRDGALAVAIVRDTREANTTVLAERPDVSTDLVRKWVAATLKEMADVLGQ